MPEFNLENNNNQLQPRKNVELVPEKTELPAREMDEEKKDVNSDERARALKKYKMFMDSPAGSAYGRSQIESMGMSVEERNKNFSVSKMNAGAMGMHDYKLNLAVTGNVQNDSENLFQAANATKLIERMREGENASLLLLELRDGMQDIIKNSDQPGFKENVWKAIEVNMAIEDILKKSR